MLPPTISPWDVEITSAGRRRVQRAAPTVDSVLGHATVMPSTFHADRLTNEFFNKSPEFFIMRNSLRPALQRTISGLTSAQDRMERSWWRKPLRHAHDAHGRHPHESAGCGLCTGCVHASSCAHRSTERSSGSWESSVPRYSKSSESCQAESQEQREIPGGSGLPKTRAHGSFVCV